MTTGPDVIASAALAALESGRQIEPFTGANPDFSSADAYAVTAALRRMRLARGEAAVGRKIGFTNRGLWPQYGVLEPIWGDMYDTTVRSVEPGERVDVMQLPEPRIEPEIALGLSHDLDPAMTLKDIVGALGWIAHGFEIVQSIYPGWRVKAADCIANGGMHGRLFIGPRHMLAENERADLGARLSGFSITLSRNGDVIDTGSGGNVLDGPIQALAHLVAVLARDRLNPPLRAGEIITTGTLTRAFPVLAGEKWSTRLDGLDLPGLSITIA